MATAYIVDAVRTAGGRRGGKLAGVHPVDLAAASLDHLIGKTGIDPAAVDDVVMGCVSQAGQQAMQAARRLMREEGIFTGISSGAAAHAALHLACLPENKGKRIVFIACDTAERYLSTALFAAAE